MIDHRPVYLEGFTVEMACMPPLRAQSHGSILIAVAEAYSSL